MSDSIPSALLPLLADPDTGDPLSLRDGALVAESSGRTFAIEDGVCHLYPHTFDRARMAEERDLARMMRRDRTSARARLSAAEWARSKREFWERVAQTLGDRPATIANLGSGVDGGFRAVEDAGHRVVHFDIVPENLQVLRSAFGASRCVAGDLHALPFAAASFDAVVAVDVIHHDADRLDAVLASFVRLVAPGGWLIVQDVSAWGLFQWPKSILLPRPAHRALRGAYHRLRGSDHRPADYEFPTDFRRVRRIVTGLGLADVRLWPTRCYPNAGPVAVSVYRAVSRSAWAASRLGFHYTLCARKPGQPEAGGSGASG